MRISELTVILASFGALGACGSDERIGVDDAGPATDIQRDVGSFEAIAVSGPFQVTVADAPPSGLTITAPQNVVEHLETVVEKGVLKIRLRKGVRTQWSWNDKEAVKISLSHNALRAGSIAGSGMLDIAHVTGERFEGDIAGSGNLNLRSVEVGAAEFSIAGSGDLAAKGKADDISVEITGSGSYAGAEMEAATAAVSIAGSGDVAAKVTQTAKVSIAGSGDVAITGGAKCEVSKVGSGDVTCE